MEEAKKPTEESTKRIEKLAEDVAKLRHQLAVTKLRAELMALCFEILDIVPPPTHPHLCNVEYRN